MTASQLQRQVGKSEQVCHDLFSGDMLCAVEYMYLIFMKVMIGCALLVVTIGWSVNFYYFTNSTKPDHLLLFCNPLRTFARTFSNTDFFRKLLPLPSKMMT